jgi:hypothetical protein
MRRKHEMFAMKIATSALIVLFAASVAMGAAIAVPASFNSHLALAGSSSPPMSANDMGWR